jgi:GDP-4-dehydro-6-deoxy-D-mannose reductase
VKVDPKRLRPVEIPTLVGATDKVRALGWAPKYTVEQALGEVLASMEWAASR